MNDSYVLSVSSKSKVYAPTILNSDDYLANCSKCGSVYEKTEIGNVDLIVEGKGKYPDALLCGHWPMLLISDRVLTSWVNNCISGYCNFSVRLFRKNGEEILKSEANYHLIRIKGHSQLDLDAMGIKIRGKCSDCGTVRFDKETWEFGTPQIKEHTWDGMELFTFEHFPTTILCGRKTLDLICANKFTNFSVTRIEDMFDYCSEEIDLKKV